MIDYIQTAATWVFTRVTDLVLVTDISDRLYWGYLLLFLFISTGLYLVRKPANTTLKNYLFPRRVLGHQSSKVDICIYLINGIFNGIINLGTLILSVTLVAKLTKYLLVSIFGLDTLNISPTLFTTVLASIIFILIFDFALFFAHYLHHRIPLLWSFHKVHHSAEVLTPVTAYRFHPFDIMATGLILALVVGPYVGIYQFMFSGSLLDVNPTAYGFVLILFLLTANFRHSHIPIHYSNGLSKFLVSPAMHNVHHSSNWKHFDKNMGFMFSIWDKLAKTHYIPVRTETDTLLFGIGKNEEKQYRNLLTCYWRPIKEAAQLLTLKNKQVSDSKNPITDKNQNH